MKSMGFYRLTNLASLLFLGLAFLLYYRYPPAISSGEDCPKSIYEFTVTDIHGNDVPLSNYKGKVLLIVNVASKCNKVGYSYAFGLMNGPSVTFFPSAKSALQQRPIDFRLQISGICQHYCSSNTGLTQSNYRELNILYDKYKHQGFEILAFPCNQFAWQEPGTSEEIQEAVCTRFKAEFPIFEKIDVNGKNAAPLYKFLKSQKGGLLVDAIKWNFRKFLVNKEGKVVQRYAPKTPPLEIENDIQNLLD